MRDKIHIIWIFLFTLLTGCVPHPEHITEVTDAPPLYPDYTDITIPYNIAPLNFLLRNEADAVEVTVKGKSGEWTVRSGPKIRFPHKEWKALLEKEKGRSLTVTVTARVNDTWFRYPSFHWEVAPEPVDRYLSYRLIEPGYEVWNAIQLRERDTETFDERIIADHSDTDNSCMNCHIYGNKSGSLSMFHLRGEQGGTILNRDGKLRKLTLKNQSMTTAAVYGDFHPSGRFAVFSSNIILPEFHSKGSKRLEVYDTTSDLVIADFDTNRIITSPVVTREDRLETFPTFSPDGQWVYYCDAPTRALPDSIRQLRYSILRIPFDAGKGTWGLKADTVWSADEHDGSACHLKISPDGRYLLYTVADYGTFPIWHRETDLRMMDLQTGQIDRLEAVNSNRSDTYHSWSSDSRWFVFASKRDDGLYGKPYFSYVDTEGKAHKPFVLPQADPEHYDITLKSYNIPELSKSKLSFGSKEIRKVYHEIPAEPFN